MNGELGTDRRGFAVTALVCGIVGLVFSWIPLFGWPLPILAIVFGALARRHGPGVAGLVLGIIGLVVAVAVMIAVGASY